MFRFLWKLLFPPKCILCGALLPTEGQSLCGSCNAKAPVCKKAPTKLPFIEKSTVLWYYTGSIRRCILRYKFYGKRSFSEPLGKLLAQRIAAEYPEGIPVLTWIPISRRRRFTRGYDQTELMAKTVARELGVPLVSSLVKVRHTRPQSTLREPAARRANVLGAFKAKSPQAVAGKTVLLLDDIITTGVTASECAKTLLTAGAAEVHCAALATAQPKK